MRRFKFNLEAVLRLAQKALEDERIKLASILKAFNQQKEILSNMQETSFKMQQEIDDYLNQESFQPEMIENYFAFLRRINSDIETQKRIIERTQLDILKQQLSAKQAYIKVKSLENLKEKEKEKYNKELEQEEFKLMDDIVNSKRIIA